MPVAVDLEALVASLDLQIESTANALESLRQQREMVLQVRQIADASGKPQQALIDLDSQPSGQSSSGIRLGMTAAVLTVFNSMPEAWWPVRVICNAVEKLDVDSEAAGNRQKIYQNVHATVTRLAATGRIEVQEVKGRKEYRALQS